MPGYRSSDRRTDRPHRFRGRPRTLVAVEAGRRVCPGQRHRRVDAGHCAQRRRARGFQRRCRRSVDQPAADAGEDFETEVEGWQVERVRDHLKTEHYFHGVYFPGAFQIDGRKYVHGLAALARRAGARIFEDTPVVSIDPSGIRKRIVTPSARLRASHIVLAGNIHLGAPLRRLSETLLPVWRYAAITAPLGERLAETIAFKGSVTDSDGIDHFRIVDGDRLMWASPETTWAARPAAFCRPRSRAGSARFFPGSARSRSPRCGAARSAQTVHGMPQIGQLRKGSVGRQRLRPSGSEHLGDGRAVDRAEHSVGRRTLAAVFAVRTGLGGRPDRPGRRALSGCGGGAARPPPARWRVTGSGRVHRSGSARRVWSRPTARPEPGRRGPVRRRAGRVRNARDRTVLGPEGSAPPAVANPGGSEGAS